MTDVPTKGSNPKHGPWGHKDQDLLSNAKAATVFPQPRAIVEVQKPNSQESEGKK